MTNKEQAISLLEKLARLGNEPELGNSEGNIIAQKALALLKPCPTCEGNQFVPTFDPASQTADADYCPDCQSQEPATSEFVEECKGLIYECSHGVWTNVEGSNFLLVKLSKACDRLEAAEKALREKGTNN